MKKETCYKLEELSFEELKANNSYFNYEHGFEKGDADILNELRQYFPIRIGKNSTPQILDIVEYTNEHGMYYSNAMIVGKNSETKIVEICEQPYLPILSLSFLKNLKNPKNWKHESVSGGSFLYMDMNKLKCVGTRLREVRTWGHCGGCAHGTIETTVQVNVWHLNQEINPYGDYSTKNYQQNSFYFPKKRDRNLYAYSFGRSFDTKSEYDKWMSHIKGVEFEVPNPECKVVFGYKEGDYYHVEMDTFDKITESNLNKEGTLDIEVEFSHIHGIPLLKKVYDNTNKTVICHYPPRRS